MRVRACARVRVCVRERACVRVCQYACVSVARACVLRSERGPIASRCVTDPLSPPPPPPPCGAGRTRACICEQSDNDCRVRVSGDGWKVETG
eukprot:6190225-Pleurochrysis_carterae.AAC.1